MPIWGRGFVQRREFFPSPPRPTSSLAAVASARRRREELSAFADHGPDLRPLRVARYSSPGSLLEMNAIKVVGLGLLGMFIGGVAGCEMCATSVRTDFAETNAAAQALDIGIAAASGAVSSVGGFLAGALTGGVGGLIAALVMDAASRRKEQTRAAGNVDRDAIWSCPKCQAANSNRDVMCSRCRYSLV